VVQIWSRNSPESGANETFVLHRVEGNKEEAEEGGTSSGWPNFLIQRTGYLFGYGSSVGSYGRQCRRVVGSTRTRTRTRSSSLGCGRGTSSGWPSFLIQRTVELTVLASSKPVGSMFRCFARYFPSCAATCTSESAKWTTCNATRGRGRNVRLVMVDQEKRIQTPIARVRPAEPSGVRV